jgi:hypothetical protein
MSRNATKLVSSLHIFKQYIDLIQQFKVKKEELSLVLGSEELLPYKLYDIIVNTPNIDDEKAALLLYNQNANYPPYKVLKSELKKKLMHAVLLFDTKQLDFNDVQQAYYQCQKNWATINVLIGRLKTDAAIDLAQLTLELAQKYDLTETIVNNSRFLALQFHINRPLSRNAENYVKIYEEAHELLEAENLVQRYYDDMQRHFVTIRIPQLHLKEKALKYLDELEVFYEKYTSHRLHLYIRLIRIYSHTCASDYAGAYEIAKEAVSFFDSKPYELKNQIAMFLKHKTHCCMLLRRFEEGEASSKRSLSLTDVGTHNWYNHNLLYVQFCLHTQNYQNAWGVYVEMIENRHYKEQNQVVHDEMNILNAYLQYFIVRKKVAVTKAQMPHVKIFDANEFLDSLKAVLPNSKTGAKMPVLVAQLLWILLLKKEDAEYWLQQCQYAMKDYRLRHTTADEHSYRTGLFATLGCKLGVSPNNYRFFSRKKVEKIGHEVFEKLKAAPQHFPTQAHSLEVLPYDIAWYEVLEILPEK